MHLWPWNWADRCFRKFCAWVILGGWWFPKMKVAQNVLKHALFLEFLRSDEILLWTASVFNWGVWRRPLQFRFLLKLVIFLFHFYYGFIFSRLLGSQNMKVAQNVLKHALILEFLRFDDIFFVGGPKNESCSDVLKHALTLEFLRSNENSFWGGGAQEWRLLRMCWNLLLFWNFLRSDNIFCWGGPKNESCSECAEACARFGLFEIRWNFLGGLSLTAKQTPIQTL